MVVASRSLLENDHCTDLLEQILGLPRQQFKDTANEGFVWNAKRKRHVDAGNWTYSLLWEYLIRQAPPGHVVHRLASKYTSLHFEHPYTSFALELRGDVIEFVLADLRYTGPSVPAATLRHRLEVRRTIKEFVDGADCLIKVLLAYDADATVKDYLPPSEVYRAAQIWT